MCEICGCDHARRRVKQGFDEEEHVILVCNQCYENLFWPWG